MAQVVALPNGESASFPDDMTPDAITAVVSKQFPPEKPPADKLGAMPPTAGALGKRILADIPENLIAATRGMRMFVGAEKPQTAADVTMLTAVDALPLARAGKLAGRAAVAGGMGAGRAMMAGENPAARGALDAVGAVAASAIPFGVGKVAGAMAGPARALQTLRAQISRGAEGVANLKVLDGIMESLKRAKDGVARSRALDNGVEQITKIGESYGLPKLGAWFLEYVASPTVKILGKEVARAPARPMPKTMKVAEAAGSRAAKGLAAAAGTADVSSGQHLPVGVVGAIPIAEAALPSWLGRAARSVIP